MDIPKLYSSKEAEEKWYKYWMDNKMFHSEPDEREPYTIVIPPPNVTGMLHMGHMLNNTIQDVLCRRQRLLGKNVCWVPGTDHASIATEAKVVNKLSEEGIEKKDLTREEFMKHAWEWKEKHGGIILEQLKKLGASCDWDRTRFTLEDDLSEAVIDVFIDLFNKGLVYRGVRMINWDPKALTALSDEEVIHKEVNSKLFHVRYIIEGTDDEWLTIATTRPETILGDTAICVHPDDERYTHLKDKRAIVPLVNRPIPVIFDEYVDIEFGTGALKVTPAHDENDYKLGIKHNLETINIFNDNGTLNEKAKLFIGQDRFDVRKEIEKELDEQGYLVKVDDLINKVGYSERTDAVIEPKLSLQWFCDMSKMAKPALENVMDDTIQLYPAKFKNTYRHWMENVKDWCVSRQLWWGQQIPAWYFGSGANDFVVAKNKEEAQKLAEEKSGNSVSLGQIRQDEDVLDTWFSSWLWPISVFDGFKNPQGEDINYYYPTNDLVTGPDILFFWVARMVMAGYEYKGEKPFNNVYLTGLVRDKLGRKMSKSLGNSPDPIDLLEKYSADGTRVGLLLCSPAGNDLPFDEQLCEQGRNFTNKIWNAFRLIQNWEVHDKIEQPKSSKIAIQWFEAKLAETLITIDDHYSKYRISDALMSTYKLVWDDFCSWYLEMIKPAYQSPIDKVTLEATIVIFEKLLHVLHPFTPFITEELWSLIAKRGETECVMLNSWPIIENENKELLTSFEQTTKVISEIRAFKISKNIPQKDSLLLTIKENKLLDKSLDVIIKKMCNISELNYVDEKVDNAFSFIVNTNEYFIPIEEGMIDIEAEKKKLVDELTRTKGFLLGVTKKLSNERFVQSAPEQVVIIERQKQSDAEAKIKVLEEQLIGIG
jgi:valyl-tRNA synthetase